MEKITQAAVDLVKHFEGLYLEAYLCPAGIPTIGWGHTAGVKLGQTIDREKAEEYLRRDLENSTIWVDKYISVKLTPNQRGALASFVFNLGPGSLQASTLRKKLNAEDYAGAAKEFGRWVYASVDGKKVELPGLVARRAAEAELFQKKEETKE